MAQVTAGGVLREVPCQTYGEVRRGAERLAKVLFMAGGPAHQRQTYLFFYGNPDAELPAYPTDLQTRGEGFALDIENAFFKASLSRQMGQLERMAIKREHGLELYAGGEGHGEPPGIDWAHDYVTSGKFQKLRITLWETCPDYEVVRGPLCTIVRRWGFPYSPVHPVFSPSRLNIDIEYRFYAGLPWFHKSGSMRAIKDFEAPALRDDEWVFTGQPFTEILWMGAGRQAAQRTGAAAAEGRLVGGRFRQPAERRLVCRAVPRAHGRRPAGIEAHGFADSLLPLARPRVEPVSAARGAGPSGGRAAPEERLRGDPASLRRTGRGHSRSCGSGSSIRWQRRRAMCPAARPRRNARAGWLGPARRATARFRRKCSGTRCVTARTSSSILPTSTWWTSVWSTTCECAATPSR